MLDAVVGVKGLVRITFFFQKDCKSDQNSAQAAAIEPLKGGQVSQLFEGTRQPLCPAS